MEQFKNISSSELKAILRENRRGNGKNISKERKVLIQAELKSRRSWE